MAIWTFLSQTVASLVAWLTGGLSWLIKALGYIADSIVYVANVITYIPAPLKVFATSVLAICIIHIIIEII